jgi:formiminotetrahydrofolate cyclodeaminase
VGAFLADTALKGGLMNIEINLGSIKDKAFIKEKKVLVRGLEKKRESLMGKISKFLGEIG